MSEFLKGNFKVQKEVEEKTVEESQDNASKLTAELRKHALDSLGGSMVYMERKTLAWDGDKDSENEK